MSNLTAALSNKPPKFESKVGPIFKVSLVTGLDGELQDDSTDTFTSPKAIDPENNKIDMIFTGLNLIPCKCLILEMTLSNQFNLIIKSDKLSKKDIGNYQIKVDLRDEFFQ